MWHKKFSSQKIWAEFKKFFAEEYRDICELQHMNENKPWFHGANVAIKMKEGDMKALANLVMATPSEKDVLTQITSTIKKLSEN